MIGAVRRENHRRHLAMLPKSFAPGTGYVPISSRPMCRPPSTISSQILWRRPRNCLQHDNNMLDRRWRLRRALDPTLSFEAPLGSSAGNSLSLAEPQLSGHLPCLSICPASSANSIACDMTLVAWSFQCLSPPPLVRGSASPLGLSQFSVPARQPAEIQVCLARRR